MQEIFREQPKPPVKAEERAAVPLRLVEYHPPIEILSRTATHLRIPSEGTYSEASKADFAMGVARTAQELRLEGSVPFSIRFSQMLDALI